MIDYLELSSFHFLRPWWLLILLLVVVLTLIVRRKRNDKAKQQTAFAEHILRALTIPAGKSPWLTPITAALLLLSICAVLMAGPSWQRQDSPFVQDKAVLVIALDLSDSMRQSDIQPTRLNRAKQKILDLLALRGNARTGLIAYAGSAHQLLPLTNDIEITKQFLSAVNHDIMPRPGKRPEAILPLVDTMLQGADAPGTVLLVGDGLSQNTIARFEQYFVRSGYQLLVLGVGQVDSAKQSNSPALDGAHLKLQESELQSLAHASAGKYQSITADKVDVNRLNRLIDHHLDIAGDNSRPWLDAGYYLVYPIMLLFLLWFRPGWAINSVFAICLLQGMTFNEQAYAASNEVHALPANQSISSEQTEPSALRKAMGGFIRLWLTPDQLGRFYFERGQYQRAAAAFQNPQWQATSFYYAENFTAAAEIFRRIETPEALFNLANSLAQRQDYLLALRAYSELLAGAPDHQAAEDNRQTIQDIVDEINLMSESQQSEPGKQTKELGDQPQRADGAAKDETTPQLVERLTAEQLLADQQILAMWMRQVQVDPARFLSAKFQLQYQQQKLDGIEQSKAENP